MEAVKNEAKINNSQPGSGPVTGSPVNPARNFQGGMDPAFPNTEVNIIKPGDTKNPGNGLDSPGRGKQVPRKGKGRD
jgi:hypothetical protein